MEDEAPRQGCPLFSHVVEGRSPEDPWIRHCKRSCDPARVSHYQACPGNVTQKKGGGREREFLLGDPQGVEGIKAGIDRSVTALRMTDAMERLLHEGDLLRCFRDSVSVTYVSTLPSTSSSAPCISSFVQSLSTFETNVREWHFVQHSYGASTLRVPHG